MKLNELLEVLYNTQKVMLGDRNSGPLLRHSIEASKIKDIIRTENYKVICMKHYEFDDKEAGIMLIDIESVYYKEEE